MFFKTFAEKQREAKGARYDRDVRRSRNAVADLRSERTRLANAFIKIQEAAHDGQNGSSAYALDRLALIHDIATAMLHRLED